MKYYTQTIPFNLAEKLKEKGLSIANVIVDLITGERSCCYTYGNIFDWLMEKGCFISIMPIITLSGRKYSIEIAYGLDSYTEMTNDNSWLEAANAAIKKAITLI